MRDLGAPESLIRHGASRRATFSQREKGKVSFLFSGGGCGRV